MKKNIPKLLVLAGFVLASSAFVVSTALADKPAGNTRPGWGYGDKNHVHTGPPGQSVRPQR